MTNAEKIKILRSALEGLVGVTTKESLEGMKKTMLNMPVPEADKTVSLKAIRALIDTME